MKCKQEKMLIKMKVREKKLKLVSFAGKPRGNTSISTGDTAPIAGSKLPIGRGTAGSSHNL